MLPTLQYFSLPDAALQITIIKGTASSASSNWNEIEKEAVVLLLRRPGQNHWAKVRMTFIQNFTRNQTYMIIGHSCTEGSYIWLWNSQYHIICTSRRDKNAIWDQQKQLHAMGGSWVRHVLSTNFSACFECGWTGGLGYPDQKHLEWTSTGKFCCEYKHSQV